MTVRATDTEMASEGEVLAKASPRKDLVQHDLTYDEERLSWCSRATMSESPARRLKSVGSRPHVSFVVAWQGSVAELSRRLRVWSRWVDDGVDIVVVCTCPLAERQRIERAHPAVRVMHAAPGLEIRALRELGVAAARGDIVVIFDDTIGWTSTWRDHLPATIGGAVVPSAGVEWVAYDPVSLSIDDVSLR